jgi:hypothetical protein
VELFCREDFVIFSSGVLTTDAAHHRFDEMLARGAELAFAKQPVMERSTGIIVGYATEASRAVLAKAAETFRGKVLAMIDPTNHAAQNVARKLGFTFWKQAAVDGYLGNIYGRHIDAPDAVAPE